MLAFSNASFNAQNIPLYVGTYNNSDYKGIYHLKFDTKSGELNELQLAIATENPSFIAYSPNRAHLYAVNEGFGGTVSSFEIQETGKLKFISKVSSNGNDPCHIDINNISNQAVVSNYSSGTAAIYNLNKNGKLNEAVQVFDFKTNHRISHAHSAQFFKNELFIADLGTNSMYQYKLNKDKYNLVTDNLIEMRGNQGPRHFTLTKDGRFMYIINEYGSSVTSVKKTATGFEQIDFDSTLEEDYSGKNACADIHLSKDEKILYGSNRGENTIVVFKRNTSDGTIKKIQSVPVHGDWPRNFTIDPTGKFLLVANQKSNNISVFWILSTGKLAFKDSSTRLPSPVCLLF